MVRVAHIPQGPNWPWRVLGSAYDGGVMSIGPSPTRPLVVASDEAFVESARRWCAAAGGEAEALDDPERVRRAWRTAPVVVVDARRLDLVQRLDLPKRDAVLVVAPDPQRSWRPALDVGARDVICGADETAIVEALVSAMDGSGEACVVTVIGACGGVGASTLAAATAQLAVQRGLRSVLVDGDGAAGGIDLLVGAEAADGLRWPDLDGAIGQVAVSELVSTLPQHRGLRLVSHGREGLPVRAGTPVVSAAVRGFDVVIADVPRQLDELARELVARSVLTVIVVPRRLGGVVAANALVRRLEPWAGSVALVTRDCPGAVSSAAIERDVGLPVLAELASSRRLAADLEHGLGPTQAKPVTRVARRVLDTVGLR